MPIVSRRDFIFLVRRRYPFAFKRVVVALPIGCPWTFRVEGGSGIGLRSEPRPRGCQRLHLACKRAEPVVILQPPTTRLAHLAGILHRPKLWSLIQERDARTVDVIGLHTVQVDDCFQILNPHHIVIHVSANLQGAMALVLMKAMLAQALRRAVNAEVVALVLLNGGVCCTRMEEFLRQ